MYQLDEVWPMQALIENAINNAPEVSRALQVIIQRPPSVEGEK
ncbi:hypothetical protein [Citrobacter portucalensis]|nr:hypothetical protein [Citrobacter portucalensis]